MLSLKKKYLLIAKCLKCGFSFSTEIEVEPENLTSARMKFAKQIPSMHAEHPDLNNFDISANAI
jgi:hypothetical protein